MPVTIKFRDREDKETNIFVDNIINDFHPICNNNTFLLKEENYKYFYSKLFLSEP